MSRNLRLILLGLAVLAVLSFLDWAVTVYAIEQLGAVEGNPLMAPLFGHGPEWALAFKVVSILVAGVALVLSPYRDEFKAGYRMVGFVCGVYLAVLVWNVTVAIRGGGSPW